MVFLYSNDNNEDHWSTDDFINSHIRHYISLKRYEYIHRTFHLEKYEASNNKADKIHKISSFLNYLIEKWQENFYPSKDICVDETIIPFRGFFSFKVFLRNKPNPVGIFMYSLADSLSFYMLKVEIFQGISEHETNKYKPNDRNFAIVNRLIEKYIDKGHIVYMDNYYTTVKLADYLYQRNTGCVGTLRFNRTGEKGLEKNMARKEVRTLYNKEFPHVLLTIWYDSIIVQAISNCFHIDNVLYKLSQRGHGWKQSPLVFKEYNRKSRAIDKNNQLITYMKFPNGRTYKW